MNFFNSYSFDDPEQVGNSECLYSKIQKVFLKSKHKEDKQKNLRVSVELLTGISAVCQQNLSLQLTDDDDPLFLHVLMITEEDFKSLKSQQGLLVDFDHFPSQLVRLLEQCYNANDNSASRFLLILEEEERESALDGRRTCLKIVETNNFKPLVHLSLKIGGGSDAEIKKFMAVNIKHLKEVVSKSEKQLARSESQLTEVMHKLSTKCKEVEQLHQQWNEEKTEFHVRHMTELAQERDKLAQVQLDWQKKLETEKQELEERHSHVTKELENQINNLKLQNQVLFEKQCQSDSVNREQSKQLELLEKELNQVHQECASLRKQNVKLDTDYHEKEKVVNSLNTRTAVLEQEVKDKVILLNKQQELLRSANQQKAHLEESLAEKDRSLQRKQVSLRSLSDELVKANEILTKLQAELTSTNSKLKLRTSIALEQEHLLDTKQKELYMLQVQCSEQTERIKHLEAQEKQLSEALQDANTKLQDKDKLLKNNDNVINWLNRRLNESQSQLNPLQRGGPMLGIGPAASTPLGRLPAPNASAVAKNIQTYLRSRAEPFSQGSNSAGGAGPTSFTTLTSNSASVGTNSNTVTMAATRAALLETKQAKLGVKENPVNSNRGSEKLTQDIRSKSSGVKSAPLPFGTAARKDPLTAHHAIPSAYFPKPAPS